jgi:hypothetical protein
MFVYEAPLGSFQLDWLDDAHRSQGNGAERPQSSCEPAPGPALPCSWTVCTRTLYTDLVIFCADWQRDGTAARAQLCHSRL